jgi:hypothetical protein
MKVIYSIVVIKLILLLLSTESNAQTIIYDSVDVSNYPPIPSKLLSIQEELEYIIYTDQKDRDWFTDSTTEYSYIMDKNDSIRLSRVIYMDKKGYIQSNIEKYLAAHIYQHCGGSRMSDDTTYYLRCVSLCDEILGSDKTEYLTDTVPLSTFNIQMDKFSSFKKYFFEIKKVDTIIDHETHDSILIIFTNIKEASETLKELAKTQYQRKTQGLEEPIKLSKLNDSVYFEKFREKFKVKIKKAFKEQMTFFTLTDEQLEQILDEYEQIFRNLKKRLFDDIKNNPEKYYNKKVLYF